jgi:hypothetical protein
MHGFIHVYDWPSLLIEIGLIGLFPLGWWFNKWYFNKCIGTRGCAVHADPNAGSPVQPSREMGGCFGQPANHAISYNYPTCAPHAFGGIGVEWRSSADNGGCQGPTINTNGAPMLGSVDIYGMPYGTSRPKWD